MFKWRGFRLIAALLFLAGLAAAQKKPANSSLAPSKSVAELPKVIKAPVPFYPELARQTRIQGTVTLRVSTDGKLVSNLGTESGHPILAEAATASVKNWEFKPHVPTTFEVTFRYTLFVPRCDSECNCGRGEGGEKESVLLHLPADVELSAPTLLTYDPAGEIEHTKSWFGRLFHRSHPHG